MKTRHQHLDIRTARLLILDTEPYRSCDVSFARVDEYVEALRDDPGGDDRRMLTHLEACPACAEEADSLMMLVAADRRSPGPAQDA